MRKIILIPLLFLFYLVSGQTDWKLNVDKNLIKVYTRDSEITNYKAFRAITTINSDILSVKKVMLNFSDYYKWNYECIKSEVLKNEADSVKVIYTVTQSPWPVKNRDAVVKYRINQTENMLFISFWLVSGYISENTECVRMKALTGYWKIVKIAPDRTQIEFEASFDPGGNIPDELINRGISYTPYQTMINLRKMF